MKQVKMQQKGKKKKRQFIFDFLTEDRIEEATKLVSISFVTMNSIWMKLGIPYEQAYYVNRYRFTQACKSNWSFTYTDSETKELMIVSTSFDLYDLINSAEVIPIVPEWMKYIKYWGKKLQKQFLQEFKNVKRGEYIYGDAGGAHKKVSGGGVTYKFYALGMVYFMQAGYKGYYSRTTHKKTSALIEKLGGSVLKTIYIDDPQKPEMKGQFMDLAYLDFKDLKIQTLHQILDDKLSDDEL